MQEVACWVVIICHEGVWDLNAVVPGLMPVGESAAIRRVEDVSVDIVLEGLRVLTC